MVVGRKVELTRGNGWTRLRNLSIVHSLYQPIGVWSAHTTDAEILYEDKRTLTLHLCKFGFMPGYEVWTHNNESVRQKIASVAEEEDDRRDDDRMDEMLETNSEDPVKPEVQKFFDILRASEDPLHEHTIVSVLDFVTWPAMSFLIITSKKMLSALGMEYEKIDACKDNCMLFYKEHNNDTKCLKCGKSWFVEVINEGGEKVRMKVANK
jgi:hypothetical protein